MDAASDSQPPSGDERQDWRDRELRKKHAKLLKARRENEELKRLLNVNGIPVPSPEGSV